MPDKCLTNALNAASSSSSCPSKSRGCPSKKKRHDRPLDKGARRRPLDQVDQDLIGTSVSESSDSILAEIESGESGSVLSRSSEGSAARASSGRASSTYSSRSNSARSESAMAVDASTSTRKSWRADPPSSNSKDIGHKSHMSPSPSQCRVSAVVEANKIWSSASSQLDVKPSPVTRQCLEVGKKCEPSRSESPQTSSASWLKQASAPLPVELCRRPIASESSRAALWKRAVAVAPFGSGQGVLHTAANSTIHRPVVKAPPPKDPDPKSRWTRAVAVAPFGMPFSSSRLPDNEVLPKGDSDSELDAATPIATRSFTA